MKKLLSFILIAAVLLSLGISAFAMVQGEIDEVIQEPGLDRALERAREVIKKDEGKGLIELSDENFANYYHYNPYGHTEPQEPVLTVSRSDTWDTLIGKLFEKYGIEKDQDNLALTYYNTVTGESHAYNENKYFVTASIFKVPLCMLIAEQVSSGEISMDENLIGSGQFSYLEYRALAHSDNESALIMENYLGGFVAFRNMQVKYMGADPRDDLGDNTYYESYNTAAQIENCLKILQADPEKYPGVIENMLIDTPYEYFKMWDRRYPTAQKWGYVPHQDNFGYHDYVNNCGIIYTDQPIILVVMTDNLNLGYDVIGEYATLMIDYTNFRTEETRAVDEAAKAEAKEVISAKSLSDYTEIPQTVARTQNGTDMQTTKKEFNMSVKSALLILLILTAMVFALVFIHRRNKGRRITARWAVPAILIGGLALILCVVASSFGTLSAKAEGNPQEAVTGFFDNLVSGDYEKAYTYLSNYSSLGLENEPDSEEGKLIYDALKKSYSYAIKEDPVEDKLNATQKITFRYLDLAAVEEDAQGRVDGILNDIVQSRPRTEVYDSNDRYLESVTDEVYRTAISDAVANAQNHYKTSDMTINVVYEDGRWLMVADDVLLNALLGGTN